MCAILDLNIVSQLWEGGGNSAGQGFRKAIDSGKIQLAFGGSQLKHEVKRISGKSSLFRPWFQQLEAAGRVKRVPDGDVDMRTQELVSGRDASAAIIRSDDHHIMALAQISGARLLFTNDKRLTDDFGNPQIIEPPSGRVYSTNLTTDFSKQRRELLARTDLCSKGKGR